MTGCLGKLRVKATAICIIVTPTYTRCLLNNRRVAESNEFLFLILRTLYKQQMLINQVVVNS